MTIPKLPEGTGLLLALSGGADSMVMLDLLVKENRYRLEAVTVNHNIRPEGMSDALFTKRICDVKGVPCHIESADVPSFAREKGLSVETAARILRHEAIARHKGSMDYVAFAHHADDQAETVIMHLLRGCGTDGLNGMKVLSDGAFRPLLGMTKAEILAYAKENGVEFVEDYTNYDTDYRRNYVRLKVLPELEACYGGAKKSICALASRTSVDSDFLNSEARKIPFFADYGQGFVPFTENKSEENALSVYIETETLNGLHQAIKTRVIKRMLVALGALVDAEEKHISALCALSGNLSGKETALHKGLRAYTSFGKLFISKNAQKKPSSVKEVPFSLLKEKGRLEFGDYVVTLSRSYKASDEGLRTLTADLSGLPENAVVRVRKEGDGFRKFGGKNKKLKDFFIERKIPADIRGGLPLICLGGTVYAVCGAEISENLRAKDFSAENIYYISITKRRVNK